MVWCGSIMRPSAKEFAAISSRSLESPSGQQSSLKRENVW